MGKPYFAHPTAVIDGETADNGFCDPNIGEGTRIWHFCHVTAGARIGPRCNLGQNVYVGGAAVLGEGCKVQNNVSLYDGVELEDFVFCGPSTVFTNLSKPLPRAAIRRHESYQRTRVRRNASIGAGAVIVCGHELGEACFVAAGAVVTRDVPAHALVAGNPAKQVGWVCECGGRLPLVLPPASGLETCIEPGCGRRYRLLDGRPEEVP
ncbi:MAG: N-acetyltransferase [Deltaproteobacteria bacterium]|nr:N-acetyltransferase [Deltaproteobacteria bacterium]